MHLSKNRPQNLFPCLLSLVSCVASLTNCVTKYCIGWHSTPSERYPVHCSALTIVGSVGADVLELDCVVSAAVPYLAVSVCSLFVVRCRLVRYMLCIVFLASRLSMAEGVHSLGLEEAPDLL